MVVLNLYPNGTLEYDENEIRSTGFNNKAVIPIVDVLNIQFEEPTLIKNGIIKIRANNLDREIQCIFTKKNVDDAKKAYNDLLELTKHNEPNIEDKVNTDNKINTLDCPVCNEPLNSTKSTGFLSAGIDYTCTNCGLHLHFLEDKYRLMEVKEKTRMSIYKNKNYTWEEWLYICSGNFSHDEEKELSELVLEKKSDVICPVCENYLDKYHKKGILSFDSLICPNCSSRFEILNNGIYRFINSPDKTNKLWDYYNEEHTMDEFYNILGKLKTPNKEISHEIELNDDNLEDNNYQEDVENVNVSHKDCPECGYKVSIQSKFCPECGNPLNQDNDKLKEKTLQEESLLKQYEELEKQLNLQKEENEKLKLKQKNIETKYNNLQSQKQELTEENEDKVIDKEQNSDLILKEDNTLLTDKFTEEMLSHELTTSSNKCPFCDNIMQTYADSGILSKKNYHYCQKCKVKFKEEDNKFRLEQAPTSTRLHEKLLYKRFNIEKWKEIFQSNYTNQELKEITELNFVEHTSSTCPSCNHELAKYKSDGFRSSKYLMCTTCFMLLKEKDSDKYILENTTEVYSPLWKYKNDKLTLNEIQTIYENNTEYLDERKQHLKTVEERERNFTLFINSIDTGTFELATPQFNTAIVLKKNERPVFRIPEVVLSEPRSVRTTSGGYGGASVRVAKGVTLHSGRTQSKSESHDEIKAIDRGDLLITNKRLIFLGSNRTTNIDLNKIIAITEGEDVIVIQRSNKQKPEYFSNITTKQTFKIENKEMEVTIGGQLLKRLILGQLEAE